MNNMSEVYPLHTMHTVSSDMLDRFITFTDARPATAATYARALRQFFKFLLDIGVSAPTRAHIIGFRDHLRATGHKPATVATYIIAVRRLFFWTEADGIYPNIAAGVKGAKIDKNHKKDPLTSRQIRNVFSKIDKSTLSGLRDYAMLAVMTCGGLRAVEISRADVADLRTVGDDTVLFIQGKGKDEKTEYVKVPEPTERAIRLYLNARGRTEESEPLFASISNNNCGERMTTRSISRIVKDRLVDAGLNSDRLTAHSLRHTAATLNMLHGGTLDETQQMLRHSKIDTTMIYTHHLERVKNRSEDRIAAAIWDE